MVVFVHFMSCMNRLNWIYCWFEHRSYCAPPSYAMTFDAIYFAAGRRSLTLVSVIIIWLFSVVLHKFFFLTWIQFLLVAVLLLEQNILVLIACCILTVPGRDLVYNSYFNIITVMLAYVASSPSGSNSTLVCGTVAPGDQQFDVWHAVAHGCVPAQHQPRISSSPRDLKF